MKRNIEIIIEVLILLIIISLTIINYSLIKDVREVKSNIKTIKSDKGQMKYIVSFYFDPNDTKKNRKHCSNENDKRLNTARFTKEGQFIECFNW